MRKTLTSFAILLSLTAVSCGSKSEEANTSDRLAGVTVETVTLEEIGDITESLGVVRATTVSTIAARMMGTIVEMPVDAGDAVKAGQLVLRIDDRDVAAQLRKARAGLEEIENAIVGAEAARNAATAQADLATATYERYVALRERRSVSPQEFDEVKARYRGAIAQKEQAERMYEQMLAKRDQVHADVATAGATLSWARIVSPTDGVVTARHIEIGSQAVPGMPLLTIEDPRSYRVETTLSESSLGLIHTGDVVTVVIDPAGIVVEGSVTHVSPALDQSSRSYLVKIDLPDTPALTTGLTARVRFKTGESKAVLVPADSLVARGQLTGIWIADPEGLARLRFIKTGRTTGDRVEVLSGLAAGDRVVVETDSPLREGAVIADAASDSRSES